MPRNKVLMCCLFIMILTAMITTLQAEEPGESRPSFVRGDLPRRITAVKTDNPPVIDGVMDPGEWDDATMITGLIEVDRIGQPGVHSCACREEFKKVKNMAGFQSYFWVTYDDINLYIAHHSPPPPDIADNPAMIAVMLKSSVTQHDANIELDDSIHISIIDPVYPGGDKYVIQVNSLGTVFDCIWRMHYTWEKELLEREIGNTEGITLSWDIPVVSSSTLTLAGWFMEVAIPWSGFAPYALKPEAGEVKYMNFGRIWREMMNEAHAWKAHEEMSPAGEVVFAGDEGILVNLHDTGNLPRGQAAFSAAIKNMYAAERMVDIDVFTDSGELSDSRQATIEPDGEQFYDFSGTVVDFATTLISFRVTDSMTGEVVHLTTLPVIRKTVPDIYTRIYRGFDLVKFDTDIAYIGGADLSRAAILVTAVNSETGRRVFRRRFSGFRSYEPSLEVSTANWSAGDYEFSLVFSAPGAVRQTIAVPYKHIALPEWWDNNYGNRDFDLDRVPYPWTGIEVNDETLSVWGRRYVFGDGFFPSAITTLGYPLLRAPMRLLVRTSDGRMFDTSLEKADYKWGKLQNTRVEGLRTVSSTDIKITNDFWAEYDGLLWSRVTLEALKGTEVVSMELEIPLTEEFTDVINPYDYSLRRTGRLGQDGYSGPLAPLWLGNGDGGIQWFSETDGWFIVNDRQKILNVDMDSGAATLRVVMLDIPTVFDGPHTVEFGMIATPVRPKTWRTPEHTAYRSPLSDSGGGGADYPSGYIFLPAPDLGSKTGSSCLYVFTSRINTRTDDARSDDFRYFGEEWLANSNERIVEQPTSVGVTQASKSYRDWFIWRYWRYQQKYGYDGLYYDGSAEVVPANPFACAGYKGTYGRAASISPLLANREIHRRLYNVTLSNQDTASRDAWIGLHNSGMPNMSYMSFGNHNWNAENFNSIINEQQQTYLGVVDPAMFRAELMGHNFGWPVRFLGQGRIKPEWVEAAGGPEAVEDQLMGLVFLHDTAIPYHMPCCLLPGGIKRTVERSGFASAIERHRYFHWGYQFTPYWKQEFVELPDDMYASFYICEPDRLQVEMFRGWEAEGRSIDEYFDKDLPQHIKTQNRRHFTRAASMISRDSLPAHKAIMVVYNDSGWEGEMRLKPDWANLGLGEPETLAVENAVHGPGFPVVWEEDSEGREWARVVELEQPVEYARIEGDEIVFPMTRYNYRMIVIEKR